MRILVTGLLASALMIGSFLLWGGNFELLFAENGVPKTLGPNGWLLVVSLLMLDVFLPVPATAALAALAPAGLPRLRLPSLTTFQPPWDTFQTSA